MPKETVNWDYIWSLHAPHYDQGVVKIPLKEEISLLLTPGPGFGDLSHPTTDLMLTMLKTIPLEGKIVVDIGVGSGILSLAALLLGAKKAYAFEIDPPSIQHSKKNAELNNLSHKILFNEIPACFSIVLMNMISSEQRTALKEYPFIREQPHTLLSSGVLVEEKKAYLNERKEWTLNQLHLKEGWLGCHFFYRQNS